MTLATWWAGALHVFNAAVLAYFCLITVSYLAVTSMSALQVRGYFRRRSRAALRRTLRSRMSPPVTICASAYNEAETIVDSMRAMLTLQYPNYEVALCNDGSTDDTLERLIAAFALRRVNQPIRPGIPTKHVRGVYRSRTDTSLVVIDKENGGRSDGLNAAINAAATPLICCVDADSILEPDGLLSAVRAFLAARTGWSAINGLLIISGAFGVFRRTRVIEVGGFAPDSIGEDFELCMRLHRRAREDRRPYRMEFIPDP
ncbi:MAG: glycosyltransferase family 2 protein, partial [Solirubrobacteraceae bacterium]